MILDKVKNLLRPDVDPSVKLTGVGVFIGKTFDWLETRISDLEKRQLQKGDKGDRRDQGERGPSGQRGADGEQGIISHERERTLGGVNVISYVGSLYLSSDCSIDYVHWGYVDGGYVCGSQGYPLKYWDGAAWQTKTLSYWNGVAWL